MSLTEVELISIPSSVFAFLLKSPSTTDFLLASATYGLFMFFHIK